MATNKAVSTKKKAPVKKFTTSAVASKTTVKTIPANATKSSLGDHISSSVRLWRSLAAEFVGTFLLVAVVIAGQGQPIFVLFALVGIVLLIGAVSGAHVNPAVTIGAWVTRRIGWLRAVGYIIVQLLGAAVAFFTLNAFLGGAPGVTEEQALYGQTAASLFAAVDLSTLDNKEWYVFFAELLGASILGLAYANVTRTRERLTAAFTAGAGIFIALMVTITIGGFLGANAILNPAVALALHLGVEDLAPTVWTYAVYALAPIVGAVLGFVIGDAISEKETTL